MRIEVEELGLKITNSMKEYIRLNDCEPNWIDFNSKKYYILYHQDLNKFIVEATVSCYYANAIYFNSKQHSFEWMKENEKMLLEWQTLMDKARSV